MVIKSLDMKNSLILICLSVKKSLVTVFAIIEKNYRTKRKVPFCEFSDIAFENLVACRDPEYENITFEDCSFYPPIQRR